MSSKKHCRPSSAVNPGRVYLFWGNSGQAQSSCAKKCLSFLLLFPDFIFRAPIKISKAGELREEYESQLRKVWYAAPWHVFFPSNLVPCRNVVLPVGNLKSFLFIPFTLFSQFREVLALIKRFCCLGLPSRMWRCTFIGGPQAAGHGL